MRDDWETRFADVIREQPALEAPPCEWRKHDTAVNCNAAERAGYVIATRTDAHPGLTTPRAVFLVCQTRMIWLRTHWHVALWRCPTCQTFRTIGEHFEPLGTIEAYLTTLGGGHG